MAVGHVPGDCHVIYVFVCTEVVILCDYAPYAFRRISRVYCAVLQHDFANPFALCPIHDDMCAKRLALWCR